jgi:hypothetical protein
LAVILEGAAAGFFLCVCPRDAGNFLRVFFVGSVITHFFFFFFFVLVYYIIELFFYLNYNFEA